MIESTTHPQRRTAYKPPHQQALARLAASLPQLEPQELAVALALTNTIELLAVNDLDNAREQLELATDELARLG